MPRCWLLTLIPWMPSVAADVGAPLVQPLRPTATSTVARLAVSSQRDLFVSAFFIVLLSLLVHYPDAAILPLVQCYIRPGLPGITTACPGHDLDSRL